MGYNLQAPTPVVAAAAFATSELPSLEFTDKLRTVREACVSPSGLKRTNTFANAPLV